VSADVPYVIVVPVLDHHTPAGRLVRICPAISGVGTCCAACGLCAVRDRPSIVAFPAHGVLRKTMTERLVQLRLFDS
jgi:hypothetical protein